MTSGTARRSRFGVAAGGLEDLTHAATAPRGRRWRDGAPACAAAGCHPDDAACAKLPHGRIARLLRIWTTDRDPRGKARKTAYLGSIAVCRRSGRAGDKDAWEAEPREVRRVMVRAGELAALAHVPVREVRRELIGSIRGFVRSPA